MELLIAVIAVLFLAVVIYGMLAAAKRRKALRQWAGSRGLSYRYAKDKGFDGNFPDFKQLHRGHSRYANNVMTGPWQGMGVFCFDYHYRTGSGKNDTTHNLSGVIIRSPVPLKPLLIRPEGFFDRVAEFFGMDDIDFESAEFSKKFYVKSPDKRWAYDVIHQRMMEYLLAGPSLNVVFGSMHVMTWNGRIFTPEHFGIALDHLAGILTRLPEYLVEQQLEHFS